MSTDKPKHQVTLLDGVAVQLPDSPPHDGRLEVWIYGVIGVAKVPFIGHGTRRLGKWDRLWTWQCQYRIDPQTHEEIVRQVDQAYRSGRFGEMIQLESPYLVARTAAKFKLKYTIPLLQMSYEDGAIVRQLGAHFDPQRKKWCVLKGTNLEPFARWR